MSPRACAPQQEKPLQWETCTSQQESGSHSPQLKKAHAQQWRPSTTKNKYIYIYFKNSCVWQGLNFQSIQTAQTTQYQKQTTQFKKWTENLNRHFSREDIPMSNSHLKRCSTLLIIREIQIKTTVRCHPTPVRMAIIKKSTNNKCWRWCEETEPSSTVGGNVNWCSHYGKQNGVP